MNPELIRKRLSGAGQSLIRTSDGKQYPVVHPEFVMIGRHNVVVEKPNGLLDIIDPIHIVSIQPKRRQTTARAREN
jgi:hypothetical protein